MGKEWIDEYTPLHFAVGILSYYWGISLFTLTVLHILFELLENTEKGMQMIRSFPLWPGGKTHADSYVNQMSDTLASIVGWFLCSSLFIWLRKPEPFEMKA
jgi:membrane glycosyltransferase